MEISTRLQTIVEKLEKLQKNREAVMAENTALRTANEALAPKDIRNPSTLKHSPLLHHYSNNSAISLNNNLSYQRQTTTLQRQQPLTLTKDAITSTQKASSRQRLGAQIAREGRGSRTSGSDGSSSGGTGWDACASS